MLYGQMDPTDHGTDRPTPMSFGGLPWRSPLRGKFSHALRAMASILTLLMTKASFIATLTFLLRLHYILDDNTANCYVDSLPNAIFLMTILPE